MLIYPLAFLVTLGVLITIHEFGHFIVARWSGVRVLRFSVGFGKPLWSRHDRQGTEFALAAIPLGGYVRMLDDVAKAEGYDARPGDIAYDQLNVWWRMAIALAGPLANFLLAIVVYWWLAVAGTVKLVPMVGEIDKTSPVAKAGLQDYREIVGVEGQPVRSWQDVGMGLADRLGDTGVLRIESRAFGAATTATVEVPIRDWLSGVADPDLLGNLGLVPERLAVIGMVGPDGPGERGGIQVWDRITRVNDQPINDWGDLVEAIQASPGIPMTWTLVRNDMLLTRTVTPERRLTDDGTEVGFVGIGLAANEIRYGPLEAIPRSFEETAETTAMMLLHLKKMVIGEISVRNLGGPITIAKVAGDSAQAGWRVYVTILALLSMSLGVINLLPIPLLDGGHVLYCLAELIWRRPVPRRVQLVGGQIGLVLVGGLILLVLFNDIARFF